jgi:hypothetical protein
MLNIIKLEAGAVGAASRYGSGSTKMMRLRHTGLYYKMKKVPAAKMNLFIVGQIKDLI